MKEANCRTMSTIYYVYKNRKYRRNALTKWSERMHTKLITEDSGGVVEGHLNYVYCLKCLYQEWVHKFMFEKCKGKKALMKSVIDLLEIMSDVQLAKAFFKLVFWK